MLGLSLSLGFFIGHLFAGEGVWGFGGDGSILRFIMKIFRMFQMCFLVCRLRIRTNIPKKKLGTPTHQPFASEFQSAYLTWRPTHHPPILFGGHAHRRFRVRRPFWPVFAQYCAGIITCHPFRWDASVDILEGISLKCIVWVGVIR